VNLCHRISSDLSCVCVDYDVGASCSTWSRWTMALAVEVDKGMAKREGLDITLVGMTSRGDLRLTFAVRSKKIRVEGLISAASFGSGRTNSDRQYYYLNGRPFVATKVCTMIFHQLPRINFGTWFNLRLLERSTSCTNPITPCLEIHLRQLRPAGSECRARQMEIGWCYRICTAR
jgi:hypothetical protein